MESGVKLESRVNRMASPFRLNKKARRRGRKLAKRIADENILGKWDEATADILRRVAKLTLKQANAKRRKKRHNNSK